MLYMLNFTSKCPTQITIVDYLGAYFMQVSSYLFSLKGGHKIDAYY